MLDDSIIPWPGDGTWRPKTGTPYSIPGLAGGFTDLGAYTSHALHIVTGYCVYYLAPLLAQVLPIVVAFCFALFMVDLLVDKVRNYLPGNPEAADPLGITFSDNAEGITDAGRNAAARMNKGRK